MSNTNNPSAQVYDPNSGFQKIFMPAGAKVMASSPIYQAQQQQSEEIRQQSLIQQRDSQLMQVRNLAMFRAQFASGLYNSPGGFMNPNPPHTLIGG